MKIFSVVNDVARKELDLIAEHGQSFYIQTEEGDVVFDFGKTKSTLLHNLKTLQLSLDNVDKFVLSHAHYDHSGGLEAVLELKKKATLYAHPDIFRPRYSLREGKYQSIGLSVDQATLARRTRLILSDQPIEIVPHLWTSGGIRHRNEPVGSSPHLYVKEAESWIPDLYLDDLSLVYQRKEGLIVICGCCHAGLLNTLFQVKQQFNQPILATFGGLHLLNASDEYLQHILSVLETHFGGISFYVNHCTGENAIEKLGTTLGNRLHTFPAGSVIKIDSHLVEIQNGC